VPEFNWVLILLLFFVLIAFNMVRLVLNFTKKEKKEKRKKKKVMLG